MNLILKDFLLLLRKWLGYIVWTMIIITLTVVAMAFFRGSLTVFFYSALIFLILFSLSYIGVNKLLKRDFTDTERRTIEVIDRAKDAERKTDEKLPKTNSNNQHNNNSDSSSNTGENSPVSRKPEEFTKNTLVEEDELI